MEQMAWMLVLLFLQANPCTEDNTFADHERVDEQWIDNPVVCYEL